MGKTHWFRPRQMLAGLLAALLCMSYVQPALAAGETARTVQLTKTEGTVSITNSGGKGVSLRDNMRLYNGYVTKTDAASYAWLSLDSSKLSKLDEASEMELRKSGSKLELLLNAGDLFFNVTEPLEKEETLNIRTSTMVVGIRGTCGWVRVTDQQHSRLYVLEGRVTCSVTDPVTGQVKTTVLTGGEWADFVVYDQSRPGDKCDIIRQRYTEEAIPGFVLTELAGNTALCEKIYADSGLDLRELTADQARDRLRADQAETAQAMEELRQRQDAQERNVSTDPVWEQTTPDSGDGNDSGSGSGGGGATTPANPSGVTSTTPTTTQSLTMAMPVTIPQIQAALNRTDTSSVEVTGSGTITQAAAGETLTVAAGKTLTLASGVNLVANGAVNVDGTMNVNGNLVNNGTITVTSSNSLHVGGTFTNNGTVNNIQSGHIVPANGIQNSGTIITSGNAVLESTAGATVTMTAPNASLSLNGGSISNSSGGYAILYQEGAPSKDITGSDTTSIWTTTGGAPLAVQNADGSVSTGDSILPDGYKVVEGSGQTSLRPTGGVEGGVIVHPVTVTVTFDANGGRWPGNAPTITVEQGRPMGAVSSAPTREGYRFVNWQDANGTVYTAGTTVNSGVTLYANWEATGETPPDPARETVTVTFMDNILPEDNNNQKIIYLQFSMPTGESLVTSLAGDIPLTPSGVNNLEFLGWCTTRYPDFEYGADTRGVTFYSFNSSINTDLTLYTVWQSIDDGGDDPDDPVKIKETYSTTEATEHPDWVQQALYAGDFETIYIQAALDPSTGEMSHDFELRSELIIPSGKTLNLTGQDDSPNATLKVISGGSLRSMSTIIGDLTFDGGFAVLYDCSVVGTVTLEAGDLVVSGGMVEGTVTLNNGELTMSGVKVDSVTQNGGTLTIKGGTVDNIEQKGGKLYIKGGIVNGVTQSDGRTTVSGGTVYGYEITDGTLSVWGGTIDGNGDSAITMSGGTVEIGDDDAVVRSAGNGVIRYSGGKLQFNNGLIWSVYSRYAVITDSENPDISVSSNAKFLIGEVSVTDPDTGVSSQQPAFMGEPSGSIIPWINYAIYNIKLTVHKWWSGPSPQ